jgi:hypothetical protein
MIDWYNIGHTSYGYEAGKPHHTYFIIYDFGGIFHLTYNKKDIAKSKYEEELKRIALSHQRSLKVNKLNDSL